jgi:hypothetical protein
MKTTALLIMSFSAIVFMVDYDQKKFLCSRLRNFILINPDLAEVLNARFSSRSKLFRLSPFHATIEFGTKC